MDPTTPDVELEHLRRELGDQYALVRLIGRGGMGAVYLARERSLDRLVALKVLPAAVDDSESARERFRREARMVARLNHPGIVPLYTYGETESTLYYAMAFVDGESLAQRLERAGPLSPADTRALLSQVASALDHAHRQGLIHRDIKPSNILIEAGTGRILVTDFGIGRAVGSPIAPPAEDAREDEGEGLTRVGETVGTPKYMAPEQATGSAVDARTDLYALGLTAYEAAAGHGPFDGSSHQAVLAKKLQGDFEPLSTSRPDVESRVAALVEQCLATDPARRPDTAERVLALLADDAPASGPMDAVPAGGGLRGWSRKPGAWRGLAALGIVLAGAWAWDGVRDAPGAGPADTDVPVADAEGPVDADVPVLIARLREATFSGSFDEAEALVTEVLGSSRVSRDRKVQFLRHAARGFVRGDAPDRARRSVERMLDLEPPLVMLHPAVEPPELVEVYGAARRARTGGATSRPDPDSIVVSMGPFAVTGFDDADRNPLAEGLGTMLITELVGSVRVVDRERGLLLESAAVVGVPGSATSPDGDDMDLSAAEIDGFYARYEAAMAGTLGDILPETHIVYGSLAARGGRVLVGLWAVGVEDASVAGFAQAEGAMPDGLYDAVLQAAQSLLESLGAPPRPDDP